MALVKTAWDDMYVLDVLFEGTRTVGWSGDTTDMEHAL
jgi:hypothetical protein